MPDPRLPAFLRPRARRQALESRQLFDGAGADMLSADDGDAGQVTVAEPSELNDAGADRATLDGWTVAGNGGATVTVTATVAEHATHGVVGSLTSADMNGVTPIAGGLRFTGTAAEATNWLDQLTFTAADVELGNLVAETTITITATDGTTTDSETVQVRITPSNDPTQLPDGATLVSEGATTVLTPALLAPSDPEVTAGVQTWDQIVYGLTDLPDHGYLTLNGNRLGEGSVFTHQDVIAGRLAYVHTATGAAQNDVDRFSVRVNDGATPTALSKTATMTLNIDPVNQLPTVGGSATAFEGQPANARDIAGNPMSVGAAIEVATGGDPQDDVNAMRLTITSLPTDGTLHFTGDVLIGGVDGVGGIAQAFDRAITQADVDAGISIAYVDRARLTYANFGQRDNAGDPAGYPYVDGFGVRVADAGGGTGTPGTAGTTIAIQVLAINDDPDFVGASTREATVTVAGVQAGDFGVYKGQYVVTLTRAMLSATDPDSPDRNIAFVVPSMADLNHGVLLLNGGTMPAGARFTMADIDAGRVQYLQWTGASPPDPTDHFDFEVVDNTSGLRWNADGSALERVGGEYDEHGTPGLLADDTRTLFRFTIHLLEDQGSGTVPPIQDRTISHADSTWGGVDSAGVAIDQFDEGGTLTIRGTDGKPAAGITPTAPFLSYEAENTDPAEVVYTILEYRDPNGTLQIRTGGGWTDLGVYASFTQQDLNDGRIRFQHDGGEVFESSVRLSATAGIVSNGVVDVWTPELKLYATPVNDAPVATGGGPYVLAEGVGNAIGITSDMLAISDPDDAARTSWLEGSATLPDGNGINYAVNHDATGANALKFEVLTLPSGGTLQYSTDGGSSWTAVSIGTPLDANLLTGDAATTGLRFVSDGSEVRNTDFDVRATDRWGSQSGTAKIRIQITPTNDAPQIHRTPIDAAIDLGLAAGPTVNRPLTVAEGGRGLITSAMLRGIDPDNTDAQIQFRINQVPAQGQIARSTDGGSTFSLLGVGSFFTQAQVDAGEVWYLHNGAESNGNGGLPNPPSDRFVFTLSDGDRETTGREFWIYTEPTNDAPVVTAPAGPLAIDGTNAADNPVTGFSVADPDLATITSGETDTIQVTVRLVDADGDAVGPAGHAGVTITTTAAGHGATVDATYDGDGAPLVLRGTRQQVNAALAGLAIAFSGTDNSVRWLQVVADDRLRDANGALVVDGSGDGAANGGGRNSRPVGNPLVREDPLPVPGTEFDPLTDAAPASGTALAGNVSASATPLRLHVSNVNEPAVIDAPAAATVYEDQRTPIAGPFVVDDPESAAFDTPLTVTFVIAQGTLGIAGGTTATSFTPSAPGSRAVAIAGNGSGTLVLTGRAADIEALLNGGPASGLTWLGPADLNHDVNGGDAGDITLTMSLDDGGSRIGDDTGGGSVANEPADRTIALTIVPVDDAPTVTLAAGVDRDAPLLLAGGVAPTAVPGFVVGDVDMTDAGGVAAGEVDQVRVTIRLETPDGTPLAASAYGVPGDNVTIGSSTQAASGATLHTTYDGTGSPAVVSGTRAQVQAWLDGLQVATFGALANTDQPLRVRVIADDRLYADADTMTPGTAPGATANGGDPAAAGGGTQPAPATPIDPFAAIPAGLTGHVASAYRTLFSSGTNDPARITGDIAGHATGVPEGSTTWTLNGLTVTDADALATDVLEATVTVPSGFSISAVNGSGGTVALLPGGRSATITGTLAQINARLAAVVVALPDVAGAPTAADWNGAFDVTIVVQDQGNNGGRPDTLDAGDPATTGTFEHADDTAGSTDNRLVTTRAIRVTITPVNDAPVDAGSGPVALAAIAEDTEHTVAAPIDGDTIANLFGSRFGDAADGIADHNDGTGIAATGGSAPDAFLGVAIRGLTPNAAQGTWQYSIDGGANWTAVGPRGDANALVLSASDRLRFVPAPDFHGTPNALSVRLIETDANADGSGPSVPAAGATVDLSGAHATGGASRYGGDVIALTTTVTPVNDRPVLSGDASLATIDEDAPPAALPGRTAAELFGSVYDDGRDDRTGIPGGGNGATAFGGLAIVGNAATASQGAWQLSIDAGASWTTVPTDVADGAALLIPADARVRFVPAADYNGTPGALTVRASDLPVTADLDGADLTTDAAGPTSHWSTTRTLGVTVRPRNDAPVIATSGGTAVTATENGQTGSGTSIPPTRLIVAGSVTVTDRDAGSTPGIAATAFGAGTLTVSLTDGMAGDRLQVDATLLAGNALPAGVSVAGGDDGAALVVSFDADTTLAEVRAVIEALTWAHVGDNPTDYGAKPARGFSIVLDDGNNLQPGGGDAGGLAGGPPHALAGAPIVGTITIAADNDPPTANPDTHATTENGPAVSANVITGRVSGQGDTDPDDPITALVVSAIRTGAPAESGTAGMPGQPLTGRFGTLTLNPDGSYDYAADTTSPDVRVLTAGETLSERFTYTISDPGGRTSTAELAITITGAPAGSPGHVPPIVTVGDGNGSEPGHASVHEAGLVDGPAGADGRETTGGDFTVSAQDGLQVVEFGGPAVATPIAVPIATLQAATPAAPVTIATTHGTLTITGLTATETATLPGATPGAPGGTLVTAASIRWTFTLAARTDHGGGPIADTVTITAIDRNGGPVGSGGADLVIAIVDDAPTAVADTASITEDDSPATIAGNVRANDRLGADTPVPVTGIAFVAVPGQPGIAGGIGSPIDTTYGRFTITADGAWQYTLDNGNPAVNALQDGETLSEGLAYTITDADGNASTATLTITIHGHTDAAGGPVIRARDGNGAAGGDADVHERGLVDGPSGPDARESTSGTIDVTALDGLASVRIGGIGGPTLTPAQLAALAGPPAAPITIATAHGTLTLTGFDVDESVGGVPTEGRLHYRYELGGAITHGPGDGGANAGGPDGERFDTIALAVTDASGITRPGTLDVRIVDDVPQATDDQAAIDEDDPSTLAGNVKTDSGDVDGADTGNALPGTGIPVTGVGYHGNARTVETAVEPAAPAAFDTDYGRFTIAASGAWTYALDNGNPAVQRLIVGESLHEVIAYTITDADGDTSTATLTITIRGTGDGVTLAIPGADGADVGGRASVHEHGLDGGDGSSVTTGRFTAGTPDGVGAIEVGGRTITAAELSEADSRPIAIGTPRGTLTITGYDAATGDVSWRYALDGPADHHGGPPEPVIIDPIAIVVGDRDGDTANGTLVVHIVDDAPEARDDAATVSTAFPDPVVDGDLVHGAPGADRIGGDATATPVTGVRNADGAEASPGRPLAGRYGTLTVQADGRFRYAVDSRAPEIASLAEGQSRTDVFVYTIADADGDTSTATLTITIRGASDFLPLTTAQIMRDRSGGNAGTGAGVAASRIRLPDLGDVDPIFHRVDAIDLEHGRGRMLPSVHVSTAVGESQRLAAATVAGVFRRVGGPGLAGPASLDGLADPYGPLDDAGTAVAPLGQPAEIAVPVRDLGLSNAAAIGIDARESLRQRGLDERLEAALPAAPSFSEQLRAAARAAGLAVEDAVDAVDAENEGHDGGEDKQGDDARVSPTMRSTNPSRSVHPERPATSSAPITPVTPANRAIPSIPAGRSP
ncbi:MAG: cadherin-like domain-containing protein [Burkholderiaceae bacterium]